MDTVRADPLFRVADALLRWIFVLLLDVLQAPHFAIEHLALLIKELKGLCDVLPANVVAVDLNAARVCHRKIVASDLDQLVRVKTVDFHWLTMEEVDELPSAHLSWSVTELRRVIEVHAVGLKNNVEVLLADVGEANQHALASVHRFEHIVLAEHHVIEHSAVWREITSSEL